MSSILDIVYRDAATYYKYDASNRVSRIPTVIIFALISLMVAIVTQVASNDFLAGALSAQAILVGFSFNVLFYLVANRLTVPGRWFDIDHELRFERLAKLSDEIFDNVTYFNIVAIASVVACLTLLLIGSDAFNANLRFVCAFQQVKAYINTDLVVAAAKVMRALLLAILLFLLIESVSTFVRAVGRVRFYFTMLKEMNDATQQPSP